MQAFCEPLAPSVSVFSVPFFALSCMRFELVMLMAAPLGLVSVTPGSDERRPDVAPRRGQRRVCCNLGLNLPEESERGGDIHAVEANRIELFCVYVHCLFVFILLYIFCSFPPVCRHSANAPKPFPKSADARQNFPKGFLICRPSASVTARYFAFSEVRQGRRSGFSCSPPSAAGGQEVDKAAACMLLHVAHEADGEPVEPIVVVGGIHTAIEEVQVVGVVGVVTWRRRT